MKKKQNFDSAPDPEILNDRQVAALLGVRRRTLRLWRRTRGLPHCKITTKEIRYRRQDILSWLDQRRVQMVGAA